MLGGRGVSLAWGLVSASLQMARGVLVSVRTPEHMAGGPTYVSPSPASPSGHRASLQIQWLVVRLPGQALPALLLQCPRGANLEFGPPFQTPKTSAEPGPPGGCRRAWGLWPVFSMSI